MNANRVKMLLGGFIIVKVLIHDIILRPWDYIPNLKPNKDLNKLIII